MKKERTLSIMTTMLIMAGTSAMALDEESTYTRVGYGSNAGQFSVSVGAYAAYSDQGTQNTFVGHAAGMSNHGGVSNTYIGYLSGKGEHSHGDYNVAVGRHSNFYGNGSNNTMIGCFSGSDSNAANSVYLGHKAGYYNDRNDTLMIDNTSTGASLIYGEFDNDLVRINGTFEATKGMSSSLEADDTANNHNILAIDVNNTGDGNSDVGFSMENIETDFKWTFRTYNPSEGFAASKIGTGGTEFEVGNIGTGLSTTVVKMGGVVVFSGGHLVDSGGAKITSLVSEQGKMLAKTRAELKVAQEKIARFEIMQKRLAKIESLLTNLALDTSNTSKEKVSMK